MRNYTNCIYEAVNTNRCFPWIQTNAVNSHFKYKTVLLESSCNLQFESWFLIIWTLWFSLMGIDAFKLKCMYRIDILCVTAPLGILMSYHEFRTKNDHVLYISTYKIDYWLNTNNLKVNWLINTIHIKKQNVY